MKKKLISIIAAAAMLTSSAAAATPESTTKTGMIGGADGLTEIYIPDNISMSLIPFAAEVPEQYSVDYGIEGIANIYYNSQYLDPAIIIKSRTMLPFRDFLEAIGAAVTYDEKTKTVTASRGETEISFVLDSETIHIKNDLGEKDITMDVAPVVIEGNTYAPLRFLGEAFAMQVDWSSFQRTALIADFEKYYDELWANCPNIMKISELGLLQPERAASSGKLDMAFNYKITYASSPILDDYNLTNEISLYDVRLSVKSDGTQIDTNSDSSCTISFSYKDSEENTINITDASLDFIFKDETFYFKTDIGEQLTELPPDAAEFLQNQWFKISLEDYITLISSMSGSGIDIKDMRGLLNHSQDPREMLKYQIKTRGSNLYSTYSVDSITMMVKLLAQIDSFINVSETGEDDYILTLKMNKDDLLDCITSISTEEDTVELRDNFNNADIVFNIDFEEIVTDKIVTSEKLDIEFSEANVSLTINSDSTVDPNAEIEDIEVPENAVDILEKIYGI